MPAVATEIPRWRWWLRGWRRGQMAGAGFIFKSAKSPHNNLMVCVRPYEWACRSKRFGIERTWYGKGWPIGTQMIVLCLGRRLCISIHITPNREVAT